MLYFMALCLFLEAASAADYHNSHYPLMRNKRQTAMENQHYCNAVRFREYCSTSYAQNFINAISKCGEKASRDVYQYESLCRQNKQDLFCTEVFVYFIGNCTEANSTQCCNLLELAGCCINLFVLIDLNATVCNITIPPPCPHSNLQIPNIDQNNSCSSEKYSDTEFLASCDNIGPVNAALKKEEACKEVIEREQNECISRNGQYCRMDLNSTSTGHDAVINATNNCRSVSSCPVQCNSSLNFVKKTIGCCFHYFNSTNFYYESPVFNAQLWKECGIQVPQRCDDIQGPQTTCGSSSVVHDSSFMTLCLIFLAIRFPEIVKLL